MRRYAPRTSVALALALTVGLAASRLGASAWAEAPPRAQGKLAAAATLPASPPEGK